MDSETETDYLGVIIMDEFSDADFESECEEGFVVVECLSDNEDQSAAQLHQLLTFDHLPDSVKKEVEDEEEEEEEIPVKKRRELEPACSSSLPVEGETERFWNESLDGTCGPLEILQNFITPSMIQDICHQTNNYAETIKYDHPYSAKNWPDVEPPELWRFLALNILMGIVKKPSMKSYWSQDFLISTPIFSKTMSRDRYEKILRSLHLCPNILCEFKSSPMEKLGNFLPSLLENFKSINLPHLYLDETSLFSFLSLKSSSVVGGGGGGEKNSKIIIDSHNNNLMADFDKMTKPYVAERKTMIWYKKIFFHLIDLTVYNAYRTFKDLRKVSSLPYLDFLTGLVREILDSPPCSTNRGGGGGMEREGKVVTNQGVTFRTSGSHFVEKVYKNGRSYPLSCAYCRLVGVRRETSHRCQTCNVRLCTMAKHLDKPDKTCFELYHTEPILPTIVKKRKSSSSSSSVMMVERRLHQL